LRNLSDRTPRLFRSTPVDEEGVKGVIICNISLPHHKARFWNSPDLTVTLGPSLVPRLKDLVIMRKGWDHGIHGKPDKISPTPQKFVVWNDVSTLS
jgi:hypothetical protein